MTRGRFSFFVFLLLLVGPVIALNFGGFDLSTILRDRAPASAPTTSSASLVPGLGTTQEPAVQNTWLNRRPELRDIFIADERTPARAIVIEEVASLEELFSEGEDIPSSSMIALYATARAPARLSGYCAEVIATIALSCEVLHTQTHQNPEGDWVMSGRLGFVPAAPLGDPSSVRNGQVFSAKALLPFEGNLRPANIALSRAEMLTQAQDICDRLRDQLGNCVLTNVTFDVHELWITDLEVLPAGTNPLRVEATAEFTVYADATTLDQTGFEERVAALANPGAPQE